MDTIQIQIHESPSIVTLPSSSQIIKQQKRLSELGHEHNWKYISLILASILSLMLAIGFTLLSDSVWSPKSLLFSRSSFNVTQLYYLDIRPEYWITAIWAFIYAWQTIWIGYSLTCVFRKSKSGFYLYIKPDFLHYGIFIAFLIAIWSNIAWIFLWNNLHIGWSLIFILLNTFSLYAALLITHKKLLDNFDEMENEGLRMEIRFVRSFIQNGLAFYATWVSIESAFNFAIFLSYHLGAESTNAGTGALFIILASIIFYFILENIFWRQYLIYSFSPWIVLLITFSAIHRKNWITTSPTFPTRNNLVTILCLIIICALFIARCVMFILYKTILKKYFAKFKVSDDKYIKDFVQKTTF